MKKIFLLGLVFGIGGAVWLAGWYPFVDPLRLPSESSVARNGGRTESFRIQLPEDRLARTAGLPGAVAPVPEQFSLPAGTGLTDVEVELFRLRNASGKIVGIASRIRRGGDGNDYADWTLMLPARGAMFLSTLQPGLSPYVTVADAAASGPAALRGTVVGGSGEFVELDGSFVEQWRFSGRDADGRLSGDIELLTLTRRDGA